jgi:hypothetical protein
MAGRASSVLGLLRPGTAGQPPPKSVRIWGRPKGRNAVPNQEKDLTWGVGIMVPFAGMAKNDRTSLQTSIRISPEIWRRLRALAEDRALKLGGRPSASAVVEELVTKATKRRKPEARDNG